MRKLPQLFENNRAWAERVRQQDAHFFPTLARQQSPEYLWIGCSDSRVPANEIVGLLPGELFVHRNIANLVVHTDLNCLSVIQFAIEMLKVKHVIVCGHYGCSGVQTAFHRHRLGLSDNWLRHIQDTEQKHRGELSRLTSDSEKLRRLCELNVIEQVTNVCHTTILLDAWERSQDLSVHGWIYGLTDGLLRDLAVTITRPDEIQPCYERAIARPLAS